MKCRPVPPLTLVFSTNRISEEKRDIDWTAALANVDWDEALASVDWSTVSITYSSDQNWGEATAAPVVPAVTTSAIPLPPTTTSITVVPTTAAPKVEAAVTTLAAPTTTLITFSTPAATSSKAAATTASSSSSSIVSNVMSELEEIALKAFGVCSAGINSLDSSSADVFIGTEGPYTMEVVNSASESLYLVAWGPSGSWVNANQPLVTLYLPVGGSTTLSFVNGASGAISAFYGDTSLVNGQVSNTWIEFTMSEEGVFDISKEVNMNGHSVEVTGPSCISNMSTCVFQCVDTSVTSCEYDYELVNCANGSQEGANFGTFDGADSGGCGGLGSSAAMTATFL